jgi:hypothetical protein
MCAAAREIAGTTPAPDGLEDYLRLIAREIGLDVEEAKLAMEDGSG